MKTVARPDRSSVAATATPRQTSSQNRSAERVGIWHTAATKG
ncbi:hypothetical protein [Streptomyces flaveus]